jgi:hypothetical protein
MPVALGAGALVYSALTDYELGLARFIPMPTHLFLDGLSGAFLVVSPWVLGLPTTSGHRTWWSAWRNSAW